MRENNSVMRNINAILSEELIKTAPRNINMNVRTAFKALTSPLLLVDEWPLAVYLFTQIRQNNHIYALFAVAPLHCALDRQQSCMTTNILPPIRSHTRQHGCHNWTKGRSADRRCYSIAVVTVPATNENLERRRRAIWEGLFVNCCVHSHWVSVCRKERAFVTVNKTQ